MLSGDPQVSYTFASYFAEVGSSFFCSVSRAPDDGQTNEKSIGKARAIRVTLDMATEGRGTRDSQELGTAEVPIDRFGKASGDLEFPVPADAPISYDGQLIRVRYTMTIRTDTQLGIDPKFAVPVVVVPKNGANSYDAPHPLRR